MKNKGKGKQTSIHESDLIIKENVFPSDWKNPTPQGVYDFVVIGGGPGGMTAAMIAKSFNAKVAIVEKEHMGGECFNVGCIPSKALLRSSRLAAEVRGAQEFGIDIPKGWSVNFPQVVQRVHGLQATLSPHDSAAHLKQSGIDVFLGAGRFTGRDTLDVAGKIINFKKACVLTGTQPIALQVPGLDKDDYFTNQNIFTLTHVPKRLAVIGGGPIACELSQAFLRFGSDVTLITRGSHLLPKDDSTATERLQIVFEREGMKLHFGSQVTRVEKRGNEKILYLDKYSEPIICDEILVAIGRAPVVEGLGLDAAGVVFEAKKGILTDEHLQTSNPNIYAAGDVTSAFKFTHISMELAKMAVENALNHGKLKKSSLIVPWCTYTDPEIAHVGLSEKEAEVQGILTETLMVEMESMDRALLDGETIGFAKLLIRAGTDELIGATIMARHAGDMISEVTVAIASEKGLSALSHAIHPFPTQAQIVRKGAEALLKIAAKGPARALNF